MDRDIKKFTSLLFDSIEKESQKTGEKFDPAAARQKMADNLAIPVTIIGIGQTGVGKTELLKSIFRITEKDLASLKEHRTSATKSATKKFSTLRIQTRNGFKVEFTDGPGLGEDEESDERYMAEWISEIPKHDLLYWVLDAASRDIRHIQQNMRRILDATGFRDRFLLVLNKVDNIQLEEEDREVGEPWDSRFNMPTTKLLEQIERRTADVIARFERFAGVHRDQIVVCSALKRWNHDLVLDKMLELLPAEKRIKVAENRDVKSAVELMAPDVKRRLESESK